jgi:ABC-type glucose/galactose transport system permease subunit
MASSRIRTATSRTRIRDAWGKEAARDMGMARLITDFSTFILNGLYWGVYEFSEKIDASFAANNFGDKKSDYDAIASKPTQAVMRLNGIQYYG